MPQPSPHRLPGGTTLGPVSLAVTSLARSTAYYQKTLGLEVIDRSDQTALMGVPQQPLIELHGNPKMAPVPRTGLLGLFHFALLLPDRVSLGRFVAHLDREGIRFGAADHLVSEAIYLSDPDGLGIEVYADRPRSEWQYAGGQLVMGTEPLDLHGLVAAGNGSWTGAPAGTKMGHLHLNVNDLPLAQSFYGQGIGFEPTVWGYPGALFLSAGGYHHHLAVNVWRARARAAGLGDARLLSWRIVLPTAADVAAAAQSLETAGHRVERDGGEARATDPWGTLVIITETSRQPKTAETSAS